MAGRENEAHGRYDMEMEDVGQAPLLADHPAAKEACPPAQDLVLQTPTPCARKGAVTDMKNIQLREGFSVDPGPAREIRRWRQMEYGDVGKTRHRFGMAFDEDSRKRLLVVRKPATRKKEDPWPKTGCTIG